MRKFCLLVALAVGCSLAMSETAKADVYRSREVTRGHSAGNGCQGAPMAAPQGCQGGHGGPRVFASNGCQGGHGAPANGCQGGFGGPRVFATGGCHGGHGGVHVFGHGVVFGRCDGVSRSHTRTRSFSSGHGSNCGQGNCAPGMSSPASVPATPQGNPMPQKQSASGPVLMEAMVYQPIQVYTPFYATNFGGCNGGYCPNR